MAWLWVGFIALVIGVIALDLGVLSRGRQTVSVRRAVLFTAGTVVLALAFSLVIFWLYDQKILISELHAQKGGASAAARYLSAWLIEYALSMDNILVIALIFRYFRIEPRLQHRILFWGVLGALIMRGIMIGAGSVLLTEFQWIRYIFGAILFATALKLFFSKDEAIDPDRTLAARLGRRLFRFSPDMQGEKFFTRGIDGRWLATPLFLVLFVVEGTDVLFALDSIPAAFAISKDPFVVFTSNIFAVLGLRSMYFALAAVVDKFHHLKHALILVLLFISVKMILKPPAPLDAPHPAWMIEIPAGWSLLVVSLLLAGGILASWIHPAPKPASPAPGPGGEPLASRPQPAPDHHEVSALPGGDVRDIINAPSRQGT